MENNNDLLLLNNVHSGYGDVPIIQGASLKVCDGEIVALLGRNGVGKTTLLKTIMGILPIKDGEILFDNNSLKGKKSYQIARYGIGYVPQGREVFANLTVRENLEAGGALRKGRKIPEMIFDYFPRLKERLSQKAGSLSGGEQQMLAVGRAMAGEPKILLLDEPTEGIQPSIVDAIQDIIIAINKETKLTIIVVEQNLSFVLGMAERYYVMEKGSIVDEGIVDESTEDKVQSYLTV